jgi:hypothetical protein
MHVPAQQISDITYQISHIRFSRHIIKNQMRINLNFGNSSSTLLECLITFSSGVTAKFRPRSPHCWGFYIPLTHTHTQTQTPIQNLQDPSEPHRSGRYLYTAQHDEFETAIPAVKRLQICPLDSTVTDIGMWLCASRYSNSRSHYMEIFKEVLPL